MIRSVNIGALVRSAGDFDPVVELLTALGLRKGFAGENANARSTTFFPIRLQLDLIQRKKPWDDVDLVLTVQDPDSAFNVVQRQGLKVLEDYSGTEPSHGARHFEVQFPGGTRLLILGGRVDTNVADTDHLALEGNLQAEGKHFGIIVSRFNSFITERLVSGAIDGLVRCGAQLHDSYQIVRVPGAFEIPSAARTLASTGEYDALICIGCLLRGDTAHYDVIVNEVTRGIGQSAQETGVPHAFGVLTCDTLEQAIDRAGLKMGNKGFEAALAAVEMASLTAGVRRQASGAKKRAVSRQLSAISKSKTRASQKRKRSRS